MANSILAKLGLDSTQFESGLQKTQAKLASFGSEAKDLGNKFKEGFGPLGKLGIIGAAAGAAWMGFKDTIATAIAKQKEFGESGDGALQKGVEAAIGWQNAADRMGESFDKFKIRALGALSAVVDGIIGLKNASNFDSNGITALDKNIDKANKTAMKAEDIQAEANKVRDETARKQRSATENYELEVKAINELKAAQKAATEENVRLNKRVEKANAERLKPNADRSDEERYAKALNNAAESSVKLQQINLKIAQGEQKIIDLKKAANAEKQAQVKKDEDAVNSILKMGQEIADANKQEIEKENKAKDEAAQKEKEATEKQAALDEQKHQERMAAIAAEVAAEAEKQKAAIDKTLEKKTEKLQPGGKLKDVMDALTPQQRKAIENGQVNIGAQRQKGETRADTIARLARTDLESQANKAKAGIDTTVAAANETPEERKKRIEARDAARKALGIKGDPKADAKENAAYNAARGKIDGAAGGALPAEDTPVGGTPKEGLIKVGKKKGAAAAAAADEAKAGGKGEDKTVEILTEINKLLSDLKGALN